MLLQYLPILIAVGGLVLYGLAEGKASEVGRIMFFCGLFVYLMK